MLLGLKGAEYELGTEREREREREMAAGSEHRIFAVGIDFRWRKIALLAAVLGSLAYLAAALSLLA